MHSRLPVPRRNFYHHDHGDPIQPLERKHGYLSSSSYFRKGGGLQHDEVLLQTMCQEGHLDKALHVLFGMETALSINMYLSLLKACSTSKALIEAKQVHAHGARHSARLNSLLGNHLVAALSKCGAIEDACQIFWTLPYRTVLSWTALISAYTDCGRAEEGLRMHQCMQEDGVEPNSYTFVSLFKACGSIRDLRQGKKLHVDAHSKGLTSDVFVGSTLVSMYGKCGAITEAEDVFSEMSQHNVVSWSAMLSAYVEYGQGKKGLQLYRQMQKEGVSANEHTLVFALQACGTIAENEALLAEGRSTKVKSLAIAQALHADAKRTGFTADVFVGSTLISTYGKCGAIVEAEHVFSALCQRNVVSWSAMLSAYVEHSQGQRALQLYRQMQQERVSPDQLTFVIAFHACSTLAEKEAALVVMERPSKVMSLEIGCALHADASRKGFTLDVFVGNTLLRMYGKCGAVGEAERVFAALSKFNVVSLNALLSVYVEQSQGEKALRLYRWMQKQGATLDHVTLICVLQACSATGSLEISKQLHFNIVSAGYEGIPSVASTLIHAYGSCASMIDAHAFFNEVSEPHIGSWNACIAGHAGEGNLVASLCIFKRLKLAGMKPDDVTLTLVISACSHAGLVAKGLEYFEFMSRDYGVTPDLKHYGTILELLGRAGDFKKVENVLRKMPMQADMTIWLCLLGACRTHGNLELARHAFNYTMNMQPTQATAYVLMSNLYADAGLQESAAHKENI